MCCYCILVFGMKISFGYRINFLPVVSYVPYNFVRRAPGHYFEKIFLERRETTGVRYLGREIPSTVIPSLGNSLVCRDMSCDFEENCERSSLERVPMFLALRRVGTPSREDLRIKSKGATSELSAGCLYIDEISIPRNKSRSRDHRKHELGKYVIVRLFALKR